jgi:hypothetical protein
VPKKVPGAQVFLSQIGVFLQILAGLLLGYLAASVSESWCHRQFGHTAPNILRRFRRHRVALGWLREIRFAHAVLHHRATFIRAFTEQFQNTDERLQVINRLPTAIQPQVQATNFGVTITLSSFPFFMGLPLVFIVPVFFVNPIISIAACSMLPLPPLLSMHLHPLMHMPYEKAAATPGFTGFLMRTAAFRWIVRHHWLHHRHEEFNFNLLPGGDFLLGTHRSPSPDDLREMAEEGIPVT